MSLFPKVGRTQPKLRIAWWVLVFILSLGVLLHLFPFYYMMVLSITPAQETLSSTPVLWPREPTMAAWKLVYSIATSDSNNPAVRDLMKVPFWIYLRNSFAMSLGTVALSLPITSLAAYASSKLQRGPSARWTFLFFIGTLMVPEVVVLIPKYLLTLNFPFALPKPPNLPGSETAFPTITVWNTYLAVILPSAFNAFNFLLFKGFFDTIPDSIIQAARVDGGSEFNIFRRIVLPISVPVYAVAVWLQFGAIWDGYLWPLIVIQSSELLPASVAIANLMNKFIGMGATDSGAASQAVNEVMEAGLSWNGLMVLGLLQSLPIFILFIICREYLLKGIRLRGLK